MRGSLSRLQPTSGSMFSFCSRNRHKHAILSMSVSNLSLNSSSLSLPSLDLESTTVFTFSTVWRIVRPDWSSPESSARTESERKRDENLHVSSLFDQYTKTHSGRAQIDLSANLFANKNQLHISKWVVKLNLCISKMVSSHERLSDRTRVTE